MMILYCTVASRDEALKTFSRHFSSYYAMGAEVKEGFHFDSIEAQTLVSDKVRTAIETEECFLVYHTSFHYNYS